MDLGRLMRQLLRQMLSGIPQSGLLQFPNRKRWLWSSMEGQRVQQPTCARRFRNIVLFALCLALQYMGAMVEGYALSHALPRHSSLDIPWPRRFRHNCFSSKHLIVDIKYHPLRILLGLFFDTAATEECYVVSVLRAVSLGFLAFVGKKSDSEW